MASIVDVRDLDKLLFRASEESKMITAVPLSIDAGMAQFLTRMSV